MERLCALLVSWRLVLLTATLVATLGAAYLASTLKIYDDPNRWPPKDDPAVVLNDELQRMFGGANLVTIMIARNDGQSIVQPDTLAMVKRITDELRLIHGVIPYALRSLSTINSRYLKGTADTLDAGSCSPMRPGRHRHQKNLNGPALVSRTTRRSKTGWFSHDGSAVIIQADFRTGLQDVREGLQLPVTRSDCDL